MVRKAIVAAFSAVLFVGVVSTSFATDYSAWKNNQQVVITPPTGTAALTNFPVLIALTSANNAVFTRSRSDGFDVRFTSADGTTDYAFQRQSFSQSGRTAEFWVKVPSIAAAPATTTIKMYWGNTAATDVSSSKAVFDTALGYRAVWHMNSAVGQNELDATGSGHDLVPTSSPTNTTGPVGAGVAKSFDGSSQLYTANNSGTTSTLAFTSGGPLTISAWVNPGSDATCQQILGKINTGTCSTWTGAYGWCYSGSTSGMLRFNDEEDNVGFNRCYYNMTSGSWTHLVWVRNGTGTDLAQNNVYVNGASAGTSEGPNTSSMSRDNSLPFTIGADAPLSGASSEWWGGSIQEVQVMKGAWSASQIGFAYKNQSSPTGVISFGTVGVQPNAKLLPGSHLTFAQKGMTLKYDLPKSAAVRISLLDIRGKTVLDVNRTEEAGNHAFQLNRANLSAGTYIACLRSSGLEKQITVNITR